MSTSVGWATAPAKWSRREMVAAGVTVVAVLAVSLFALRWSYARDAEQSMRSWRVRLAAMADDRRAVVDQWVTTHLADARLVAEFPTVQDLVAPSRAGAGAGGAHDRPHLERVLESLVGAHDLDAAWVLDSRGGVLAATGGGALDPGVTAIVTGRASTIVGTHRGADGLTHVHFVVAIPGDVPGPTPRGYVVLVSSLGQVLDPLLTREPTPSATAETFLVASENGSVVFLSPLRREDAHSPRYPALKLAAARALRGDTAIGRFSGDDGIAVLAATRSIQGARWGLVAKVDEAEVLELPRQHLRESSVSTGLVLLFAGGLGFILLGRIKVTQQLLVARAKARFGLLVEDATDPILFLDERGRILAANLAAQTTYGLTEEEFRRLSPGGLRSQGAVAQVSSDLDTARKTGRHVFETTHRRADGTEFQVELSARYSETEDGPRFLIIARDLTPRREAERRIRFLNRMLRALAEVGDLFVRETDVDRLIAKTCDKVSEVAALPLAWFAWADVGGELTPVCSAGSAVRFLDSVERRWDRQTTSSPEGRAFTERRLVTVDDTGEEQEAPAWSKAAVRFGLRSCVAAPITVDGRVIAVLGLYSDATAAFDAEARALVAELAAHLGQGLAALEARRGEMEARQLLERSEERFRLALRGSAITVFEQDSDLRYSWVYNWHLGNPEAMLGKTDEELGLGESAPGLVEMKRRVLDGGRALHQDVVVKGPEGVRHLELTIEPLRDGEGKVMGLTGVSLDMTEARGRQEELRQYGEFLQELIDTSPVAIIAVDTEGKVDQVWNDAADHLFGWTRDEVVGRFVPFVGEDNRPEFDRLFTRVRNGERLSGLELIRRHKDGGSVEIGLSVVPLHDASGAFSGALAVAFDIGERRRRERDLLHQAFVLSAVNDAVVAADAQLRITAWNPAAQGLYGWTASEAIGKRIDDVLRTEFLSGPQDTMVERMLGRGYFEGEVIQYRKDGTPLNIETRVVALPRADGEAPSWVAANRDLTDRVRAQEAVRRLSRAVEQSPVSIFITDREGRIEYVNPKFVDTTGYTVDEALGKTPRILKSPDTPQSVHEELWRTLAAGEEWRGELQNRRKDGQVYWALASVSPIKDGRGEVTHFVAIQEDVTKRRAAEQELHDAEAALLQSQKIEAVGLLAGGIAHDFNNILGVILGYGQMLARNLTPGHPGEPKLRHIMEAANRASSLTRQLLAFSRRQILHLESIDVNRFVRETYDMLARLLEEDVRLELRLDEAAGRVRADPSQLTQVLLNLAVNARDAMPDGGVLTIETRTRDADGAYVATRPPMTEGRYVVLSVTDTGVGMDEQTRQRVFEPFFTTKAVGQGTGLGLSTVYGIVKQSGGFLWVRSALGEGTTFEINLPETEPGPTEAPSDQASGGIPAPATTGGTILVVEDQDGMREMVVEVLQEEGYQLLWASDGEEALRVAARHDGSVDLLLTDVVMPGMNGRVLAERLTETRPGIRVLYISGYTRDAVSRRGVLDADVRLLEKPFTAAALLAKVQEALNPREST